MSRLQLDDIDSPTIDLVTSHGAVSAEGVLLFFYHIVQDLVVDLVQGPRIVLRHGQTPSLFGQPSNCLETNYVRYG